MFSKIIDGALRNRSLVLGVFVVLCIAGFFSITKLPVDAVPDITNVQSMVITRTGALDPEKVESTVTYVIETELQGIPKVEEIRSVSKYGLSLITIIFDEDANPFLARQQISERLNQVKDSLPTGITPELAPLSTGLGEVFFYVVQAKPNTPLAKLPERDRLIYLRTVQDYLIKRQLKSIKGVADVDTFGGYPKEIHINLNTTRLASHGLTIEQVVERLQTIGENYGGGYIQRDGKQIVIRTLGQVTSLEKIRQIPIKRSFFGAPVKLGEICEVIFHHPQPLGGATYKGEEAIIGMPMMLAGANSRNVAHAINKAFKKLDLPQDVEVKALYSRDYLVNATVKTVLKNLSEGAAFVVIVLLMILGNIRAAILVSLAIPVSMLIAVIGMNHFHVSGNLMSLGAIDFGLLVDGSVVMFENMIRRMEDYPDPTLLKGKIKRQLILESTLEVLKPVITALIIIMGVFVPLFALEGVEGKMFRPMAQTVLLAMAASLVLAIVLMPVLGYLFFRLKRKKATKAPSEKEGVHHTPIILRYILKGYEPLLRFALKRPWYIIAPTIALTLLSFFLFTRLGGDFIPRLNEGDAVINLSRAVSTSFDKSLEMQINSEKIILTFPEAKEVFSRFGTSDAATDPQGVFFSDTFVILEKDSKKWRKENGKPITKEKLMNKMQEAILAQKPLSAQEISITQPIEMRFNEMLEGSRADVTMRVYGTDLNELHEIMNKGQAIIEKISGVQSVQSDPIIALAKSPVLDIELDYNAISYYGLDLKDVNQVVETAMSGHKIGNYYENSYRFPIITRLDSKQRNDVRQIRNIPVGLDAGGSVPLHLVAKIQEREQVTTIARSQGRRYAALSINLAGVDVQTFVNRAQKAIEENLKLPPFYEITWGGQFKNLQRASKRLAIIIPITLLAIFLLLLRYFGGYKQSLLVFMGIPVAVVGGVLTLNAIGMNFSISAGVGFIALMGIAILNSLVLVTHYDELRVKHPTASVRDLIFEGTLDRFRPVIITTLVAGLGFLPMAINSGLGSEVQKPLASVVIGGLIIATILTALLLPTLYTMIFLNSPPPQKRDEDGIIIAKENTSAEAPATATKKKRVRKKQPPPEV
ncbi:MAG: Nickel and cobalt resistance protein CnrA [Turneriella sp.]|nr:Nickel and cobalt resistance protein CnrA [Turneriella sp.]